MTKATDKWQTRPLMREGAPQEDKDSNSLHEKQIWSWVPEGARHQDWLADGP
jgi:hypothetical protein